MSSLTLHINQTPQIVVAAVNGPAYGGGLALAAACDLRVAATSATLCAAFIKTGLTATDIGLSWFLPRLVGASRAFDLMVSGRTIDAAEAERMGLVSRVLPDEGFEAAALEIAETVAGYTSYGLRATKEVMWANLDAPSLPAAPRPREPQPGDGSRPPRGGGLHGRVLQGGQEVVTAHVPTA